MSLPTIQAIHVHIPEAKILIGVRPHLADCYRANPAVDEVIACPTSVHSIRDFIALTKNARSLKFRFIDAGVLLTNSFSTAIWMWLAGCKKRIGVARDGRGFLLTHPIERTAKLDAAHQADYYLHIARALGFDATLHDPELVIPPAGTEAAASFLSDNNMNGANYCIMAPVSAYGVVKDWPAERFVEVGKHLHATFGMRTIVTGTPDQTGPAAQIASSIGPSAINAAGHTDLAGFLGLIDKAALFVGNDSGGAHAAAACGIPTVVLFGITEPSRTRPLGNKIKILGSGGTKTPDLRDPTVRRAAKAALENISIDSVLEAIHALCPSLPLEKEASA